jgi:hypothetical protein
MTSSVRDQRDAVGLDRSDAASHPAALGGAVDVA